MKICTSIGIALLFSAATGIAATMVRVNNWLTPFHAENAVTIVDNAGTPLSNVALAVGVITGPITNRSSVLANFTPLGTSDTGSQHHFTTQVDVAASPEDGSPVYVVLGNGEDFASSTDFIVYEGNGTWVVEDDGLGGWTPVQLSNSTLLYGTPAISNNTGVGAPFTAYTNGVTFGVLTPTSTLATLS